VIVWLASFPRSGNTFLRIILYRYFGNRSSVVYDVDGVAAQLGPEFVGFEDRPASFDEMRQTDEFHFIKTHRLRDQLVHERDKAICLVRDGRDALVSWARLRSRTEPHQFESQLRMLLLPSPERGTGGWGQNVLSWLQAPSCERVVLKYSELIANPARSVTRMLDTLGIPVQLQYPAEIPEFAQLKCQDPGFFRRGIDGSYVDEMPAELHDLFWSIRENSAAMKIISSGTRP
jgi:hypothetical protein